MNLSIEEVMRRTILYGYRGSIAHGTYVAPDEPTGIDDKDTIGICVAPPQCYFGLEQFEQKEVLDPPTDIVVYEIRKMFRLLLKGNPNVLGLLWLEPNHYIKITPYGQKILDNRNIFVSLQAFHSFAGYADGQFKRMVHFKFEGYMGQKRKQLVEKFGYDCKNASHLVRLLRQCIEFLKEGRLYVLRQDAKELIAIKRGAWTLDQVRAEAEKLFALARETYARSPLPPEPDKKAAEKLLMEIIYDFLGKENRDDCMENL